MSPKDAGLTIGHLLSHAVCVQDPKNYRSRAPSPCADDVHWPICTMGQGPAGPAGRQFEVSLRESREVWEDGSVLTWPCLGFGFLPVSAFRGLGGIQAVVQTEAVIKSQESGAPWTPSLCDCCETRRSSCLELVQVRSSTTTCDIPSAARWPEGNTTH